MEGTIRTFSNRAREQVPQYAKRVLKGIEDMFEGKIEFVYHQLYPVGRNDPVFSQFIHRIAEDVVGKDNFEFSESPLRGSEDFWFYAEKAPACFLGIGCGNKEDGGTRYYNHHPKFDIDEECMAVGMSILVRSAVEFTNFSKTV